MLLHHLITKIMLNKNKSISYKKTNVIYLYFNNQLQIHNYTTNRIKITL